MATHSVYFVQNLGNGKGYIGKTSLTVAERWAAHVAGRGHASYLLASIRKYGGMNFVVSEIESGLNHAQANEVERWWIARLKTNVRGNGYNQTKGGDGGAVSGTGGWNKGSKTPAEIVAKVAAAHRGMKRNSAKLSASARKHLNEFQASLTPEQRSEHGKKARAAVKHPHDGSANLVPCKGHSEATREKLRAAWVLRRQRCQQEQK
jgi:group I intron endonuclease